MSWAGPGLKRACGLPSLTYFDDGLVWGGEV